MIDLTKLQIVQLFWMSSIRFIDEEQFVLLATNKNRLVRFQIS